MPKLIVEGPTYYSEGDEKAFFEWLQVIPNVKSVSGQVRDLHIVFRSAVGPRTLTELAALLRRYQMPLSALLVLKTARNAHWFDEKRDWSGAST